MPRLPREARAVGLVEARLVDEPNAEPAANLLQRTGHVERMVAAFHLAGPGDQWNHQPELVRQLRGGLGARQVQGAEVAQYVHDVAGKCKSIIYTKGA